MSDLRDAAPELEKRLGHISLALEQRLMCRGV